MKAMTNLKDDWNGHVFRQRKEVNLKKSYQWLNSHELRGKAQGNPFPPQFKHKQGNNLATSSVNPSI